MEVVVHLWLLLTILIFPFVLKSPQQLSKEKRSPYDVEYSNRIIGKYATYNETMTWFSLLEERHPDIVSLIDIGATHEGRRMIVMRLSPRPSDDRPAIFIEANIHAREWMTAASTNYVIHKMILRYKAGVPRYVNAMNKYIFYFLSISNPDGYVFSFIEDDWGDHRMWRKNRRSDVGVYCKGVDLNRNWNISFGRFGVSNDSCRAIFHGNGPFSEVETQNMRQFMEKTIGVGRLTLYLGVHSYGQLFLVPWSYKTEKPRNYREMERAATYASSAIKNETGAEFIVANAAQRNGLTSGTSKDWVLRHMRANYSYTFESRPKITFAKIPANIPLFRRGFMLSPSEIPLSGQDLLTGVMALVDTMNTR